MFLRKKGTTSIVKATALEILSEPLSLLVLLAALVLSTLLPAFHYHQFGEATRMARDAGLSALFTCGSAVAVFGVLRSIRREIESGTAQMALAHPISRTGFFLAKVAGGLLATGVFLAILSANTLTIVRGAEIGGHIAAHSGDIARIWGPSLAIGVSTILVPLLVGGFLNRLVRARFVVSAFGCALVISILGAAYRFHADLAWRILPVAVSAVLPAVLFLCAAAAFAIRFPANAALTAVAGVVLAFLPAVSNYYVTDALAREGTLGWGYVGLAALAILPAILAFLLLGLHFLRSRDIG